MYEPSRYRSETLFKPRSVTELNFKHSEGGMVDQELRDLPRTSPSKRLVRWPQSSRSLQFSDYEISSKSAL
jgi:hypothetical protein